jgi:hypothetical protein
MRFIFLNFQRDRRSLTLDKIGIQKFLDSKLQFSNLFSAHSVAQVVEYLPSKEEVLNSKP